MESTGKDEAYYGRKSVFTRVEKVPQLGYYFAILIVVFVAGIYLLIRFSNIRDKLEVLAIVSDSLLIVGILIFLLTSLYSFMKSRHLRIQDCMFAFSMASLSFLLASIVWIWYDVILRTTVPFPSLADLFFLIGMLAILVAIYTASKAITVVTVPDKKHNMTIGLLALFATIVMAVVYVSSTYILKLGLGPTAFIYIVYPALDILCLVLVGDLILRSRGRRIYESQVVIALGTVVLSVSHIYYFVIMSMGYLSNEPLTVTLYSIAFMLFAISISRYVDLIKFDLISDRLSVLAHK